MRFFGFADCCGLRKWTYFQHGLRFYLIFVAVFRFSNNTRFADIPFFIAASWFAGIPPYHGFRFAPVRCSERLMKLAQMNKCSIDIFLYVQSISFNIRLFGGFIVWDIRNKQSPTWTVRALRMWYHTFCCI